MLNFDFLEMDLGIVSPSHFVHDFSRKIYSFNWSSLIVWLALYLEILDNMCFVDKNRNFNKNEKESKIENPTYSFRETNQVLQLLQESQSKSKTVMSWSSRKKKEGIFCNVYFVRGNFFLTFVFYLNV